MSDTTQRMSVYLSEDGVLSAVCLATVTVVIMTLSKWLIDRPSKFARSSDEFNGASPVMMTVFAECC